MPVLTIEPPVRQPNRDRRFHARDTSTRESGRGLYDGEPENCRRNLRAFLAIIAQLLILQVVFDAYRLETRSFRALVMVATLILPVHYLARYRWKKPIFVAASILGMFVVSGLLASAGALAISAVLITLAIAPVSWLTRTVLIASVAVALAVARAQFGASAEVAARGVIPIVATMFMFRMIIYLYEQKHTRGREPLADTLSYFFVLPNCVFPHFPVIDYRSFQRGYFASGIHEIQRTGMAMMARGTVHLFIYRVVDRLFLISADAVHGPRSLAIYLVFNYLLYVRVSGQFHMACGLLHLYGFQLPETHRNYLLAGGFTDYWRRINIYWKDFMVRIVFNPVAFRLKHWPRPIALAAATAVVFVVTWLLHAYQSYWLRGVWGFSVPDALFWGILGVLVVINVQLDARQSATKRSPALEQSPWALLLKGARVVATFTVIAVLWSLWSSPSLESWLDLIHRGLEM